MNNHINATASLLGLISSIGPITWARRLIERAKLTSVCVVGLLLVNSLCLAAQSPPVSETLGGLDAPAVAISPDGSRLAFVLNRGGVQQLYLRGVQETEAKPLAGTEGAGNPVFSPDGKWVAFLAGGKLKKASIGGGPVDVICDVPQGRGVSWDTADAILYTPTLDSGVWEVSPAHGAPRELTTPKEERTHRWPQLLPGGKAVLFAISKGGSWSDGEVVAQRLDTGERKVLVDGSSPRYVSTGHLIYWRASALMAVPFDLDRLQVTGPAVQLLDGVAENNRSGAAQYSVSQNGTLVYLPSSVGAPGRKLVWVDQRGQATPLAAPVRSYEHPRVSPDGGRIAVSTSDATSNIFVYDIADNSLKQITSEASNSFPVWSPDGKRLAFRSTKPGPWNVYWKNADGSGDAHRLTTSEFLNEPSSWSPDGKFVAFTELNPKTHRDMWIAPVNSGKPEVLYRTPTEEASTRFSPDGHWLLYVSDESGKYQIYVQPFPITGQKWQLSKQGGSEPAWAPGGREVFYRNGDKMWAVAVRTKPEFSASDPQLLFTGDYEGALAFRPNYDVAQDGRFLMLQPERQQASAQIKIVPNWFDELRRRVSASQ